MSGKTILEGGLVALLLADPIFLIIMLIVGVAIFIAAISVIIIYGLETAIAFLIVSGAFVLVLQFAHVINLQKQPMLMLIPVLMFIVGYIGQRVPGLAIAPTTSVTLSSQSILALQLILLAVIFGVGTFFVVKKKHRR